MSINYFYKQYLIKKVRIKKKSEFLQLLGFLYI